MHKLHILTPLIILVALPFINVRAVALIDIGVGTNYEVGANIDTDLPPLEVGGEGEVETATTALEAYPEVGEGEVLGEQEEAASEDVVEVEYLQPGKLLKLIPVEVPVVVRVHADGRLEVKYPWYSFIVSTERERIEEKLGVRVNQVLAERFGEEGALDARGERSFTEEEAENIQAEIRFVLEEEFSTETSTDPDTSIEESQ